MWSNGVMADLGLLPGDEDGGAAAINSLGQIVGSSGRTDPDTYASFYRAFLCSNGVMTGTRGIGGQVERQRVELEDVVMVAGTGVSARSDFDS
jgi:probable HAF family extracellular repeat protein